MSQIARMNMSSRCPRCRTTCTDAELVSAVFDAPTRRMVAIDTDDGPAYVSASAAATLGLAGRDVWIRREVTRESHTRMVVVNTSDGPAFMEQASADMLGLEGRKYWRKESDRVCPACIEELRRGTRAHRTPSSMRGKWRSK